MKLEDFQLEDFHTHNEMCHHAVGTIEEYVKKAIELRLHTIGISDHFPYEFLKDIERIPYNEYAMTLEEIESYFSQIKTLKKKFSNQINIRAAFEVDFFEGQESALNKHLRKIKKDLDYILGSIHILNFNDGRGAWGFDDNRFKEEYEHYGPDKVYIQYYETEQKMLTSSDFDLDVVGHFDLPKKFGDLPVDKESVFNIIMKTLELVKKRNLVMEINTGGFRKEIQEQYPSIEIIKEMYGLDIPILLGSDAHAPNELAWDFRRTLNLLKDIGYSQLASFEKREMSFMEI